MKSQDERNSQEQIKYPVHFDLKVIMGVEHNPKQQVEHIEKVLQALDIPYHNWRHKKSAKGNFISHTVAVTVDNQEQMHSLYAQLKTVPNIKMAL